MDKNFLTQVIEKPMRRGALLDLLLVANKEGLNGDVKVKGSLGCGDHKMVEVRILGGQRGQNAGSEPWTSEEQTLSSLGIFLEEFYRIRPRGKRGP